VFTTRTQTKRIAAGIAAAAALSISMAACSSGSSDASSSKSSSSSSSTTKAPRPVASVPALSGQTTAVKLDAGFADALKQLKLTPGVVGTAKLANGSLVFPITGGNVTYFKPGTVSPYVIGQVQHEGSGFSLSAKGTTVTIANLNVDPGASKVYGDVAVNGKVAATSVPVMNLDGRTLKPLQVEGSKAVLQGTKVQLSQVAAPLLNKTFKTNAVKPGLLIGTATITINTK
jgi:hypothetical protein